MGSQGTATLNFGAFPGATDATFVVTGQSGIVSGSLVESWILPAATADHSADEHMIEELDVYAGNIVAATGFTIYGRWNGNEFVGQRSPNAILLYGQYNLGWAWN